MREAELDRFAYTPSGTFGWFTTPDGLRYATVERPWLNNQKGVSCIPDGVYECSPRRFNRGGYDAIEIKDVPNRTHILMHIANYPDEVMGCVGINTRHGAKNHQWCGLLSKKAFNAMMIELGRETFKLRIINSACSAGKL